MKKGKEKRLLFLIIFIVLGIFAERIEAEEDYFKNLNILRATNDIPAPDFTIKDINGNEINLKNLRGKVILLNFFTTW
ncbi:MAG: redoxin domain-containing protein [Nitrospinae bacterium]|nr:redoxin domain-containing protein [Nitrospinota bacterium]